MENHHAPFNHLLAQESFIEKLKLSPKSNLPPPLNRCRSKTKATPYNSDQMNSLQNLSPNCLPKIKFLSSEVTQIFHTLKMV